MLLKSLKLKNIRSYVDEFIEFPSGSVLIQGDIGSGKSTILYAVEFALFGVLRGEISGSGLLRNGAVDGSVELVFDVEGKEYRIRRVLKRSKDKVEQVAGSIFVDGSVIDGTSQELRSRILNVLGYHKDFETKSKGLLYRYTVYTPQEQMKAILFDDSESRRDTLRRLFDVDKYKRIRDNALVVSKCFRDEKKLLQSVDSSAKRSQYSDLCSELKVLSEKISESDKLVSKAENDVKEARNKVVVLESDFKVLSGLKTELAKVSSDIGSKVDLRARLSRDVLRFAEQLKDKLPDVDNSVDEKIKLKTGELEIVESELLSLSESAARESSVLDASERLKRSIDGLKQCPTCLQDVSEKHKCAIRSAEDGKIVFAKAKIEDVSKQVRIRKEKVVLLKKELDVLRKSLSEQKALKVRIDNLRDVRKKHDECVAELKVVEQALLDLERSKLVLDKEIVLKKDVELKMAEARKQLDVFVSAEHEVSLAVNRLTERRDVVQKFLKSLEDDIKKIDESLKRAQSLGLHESWLESVFVPLVESVEKQVMAALYNSFNSLFVQWFESLVDNVSARLDDSFAPVVQINGFDVAVEHLSGGEKTACALAYRLALNKVINDIIGAKTRDLLILDEPTDGFSSEQLDRMRDVLNELGLAQIIIVSHEPKMAGFVDNVLKIHKSEHVSGLVG